jgi:ABC-type branched-subunit amino acid transport system ATPase component/predicted MFS family arabinose efflux permease
MTGAVLDAEAERQARQEQAKQEVVFADDLLAGVGDEQLTLRDGLTVGGTFTFIVLLLLNSLDELESAALGVLAPDIRDTFGVSNGVIVFISAAASSFIVLGALPMGWLADRYKRGPIIGWASAVFAGFVFLTGLVTNAFTLFLARFGVGISKSNTGPVHGSLIADTYPIGVRGRVVGITTACGMAVGIASPALVGGIASIAGGDAGWRWAFFVLGLPVAALAFLAFRIPEPPRGQFEMRDVVGEVLEQSAEGAASISVEAAFARLKQIKTFRYALVAFAAMGFGLFSAGTLGNLYLEERFDLEAFDRGLLGSLGGILAVPMVLFVARLFDRRFREDPGRALALVGILLLPRCILIPVQYAMPSAVLFAVVGAVGTAFLMAAFSMVGPIMMAIVPYRLRGMGSALGSIYVFFVGATGGAVLSSLLVDAFGPRTAVIALVVPSTLLGGLLILRTSRFIKHDMSLVVAELREELAEQQRKRAAPDTVPAIQANAIDFSYGSVQVLFDVGFEVRRGEVLALLGTNGAGKSTILRVIAGLGTPSRGVVRLHGRTITYVAPEQRVHMGIQLLPGGRGIFPGMTVAENLEMAAFVYRDDPVDRERRIATVLELFPSVAERHAQRAGSLSGGQQQMLALAMTLLHEPDVLLIDELSLGLAPVLVQELLGVVERLKDEGMTIVVVEQSMNVALALADRAVFLEKGQVRFEGPARALADRDDLVRAVFLGREGG